MNCQEVSLDYFKNYTLTYFLFPSTSSPNAEVAVFGPKSQAVVRVIWPGKPDDRGRDTPICSTCWGLYKFRTGKVPNFCPFFSFAQLINLQICGRG